MIAQIADRSLRYFCKACKKVRPAKIVIVFPNIKNGDDKTKQEIEVFKEFKNIKTNQVFMGRQLQCNHFVNVYTPGFKDQSESNGFGNIDSELSPSECQVIRRQIELSLIGKQAKDIEDTVRKHCEEYQLLLKIALKQQKQARYAQQLLDEYKEKYVQQLSTLEEQENFKIKFSHWIGLKPASNKEIKRIESEHKRVSKEEVVKSKALEDTKKLLLKQGFNAEEWKKMFAKEGKI